jgi:hypothetical protein
MKLLKYFALFAVIICVSGCTMKNFNHYCRVALGTSTSALENEKVRYSKIFDKDIAYCYKETLEALKKWGAVVFLQRDKDCIIAVKLDRIFNSCIDTTEVGIFFKEIGPDKTQVDVTSLNYQLGQFVSENLFKFIENPATPALPILKDTTRTYTDVHAR